MAPRGTLARLRPGYLEHTCMVTSTVQQSVLAHIPPVRRKDSARPPSALDRNARLFFNDRRRSCLPGQSDFDVRLPPFNAMDNRSLTPAIPVARRSVRAGSSKGYSCILLQLCTAPARKHARGRAVASGRGAAVAGEPTSNDVSTRIRSEKSLKPPPHRAPSLALRGSLPRTPESTRSDYSKALERNLSKHSKLSHQRLHRPQTASRASQFERMDSI